MPAVKLVPNNIGAHIVSTKIQDQEHFFLIDTGADGTVVTDELIRHYPKIAEGLHSGIAGSEKSYMVDKRLRLLGKVSDNLSSAGMLPAFSQHIGIRISGLIGRDILDQFKSYTVDNRAGVFRFET